MNPIFCIKHVAGLLIASAMVFSVSASAADGAAVGEEVKAIDITIIVSNVKSGKGRLVAQAYNDDNWLSDNPTTKSDITLAGKSGTVEMTISVEPGEHAFSVYHDEDNSGDMNTNFIGLPAEPVGLSNKHRPRFGPPRYSKAKVTVDSETSVVKIRLD